MPRRAVLATVLLALVAAAPARADLAQLKAACKPAAPEDAPAYTYRFCDDGTPGHGGRTANPGADLAVAVPAAYAGIDGLPALDPAAAAAVPGNDAGMVAPRRGRSGCPSRWRGGARHDRAGDPSARGPLGVRDVVVRARLGGMRRTLRIRGRKPGPRMVLAFLRVRGRARVSTFTLRLAGRGPLVLDAIGVR